MTLRGFRTMESGKIQNMTAQFVTFAEQVEESDAWRYEHTDELQGAVEMALEEVELALRGKCSEAGRQLGLFDAEQNKEEVIAEFGEVTKDFVAPKKRKAKRIAE